MKYQSSFHQNPFLLKLLHPLTRIFIILVWKKDLKQRNLNLIQNLKILLMTSKTIIWKVSPTPPSIHQISHPLTKIRIRFVSTTDSKQKNSNNQHLKRLSMISKLIIWKVSPKLIWMYQLSLQINPLNILKI